MSPRPLPRNTRIAGIVTAAELISAGWQRDQIRSATRRGELMHLGRGVYADGPHGRKLATLAGGDQMLAVAAAAALVGPGAVASHESAAYMHKIDLTGRTGTTVHMTRPPGGGWRARGGIRLHAAALPAQHVTEVLGLPVTTAARTVVDLARTLEFRAGVVAADSALHQRLVSKVELESVLASCSRWRGASTAATVIGFADGRSESPLESLARVVFRDGGLPPPQLQAVLGPSADDAVRVDFFWKKYRTVVEVDGALKYADPLRARAQLERDAWLRALGYEVVHFTWHEITTMPAVVVARIRAAFRRGVLLAKHHVKVG